MSTEAISRRSQSSPIIQGMANTAAIILPVAEAEPLVASWRRQYDPVTKSGIPAHITLLYPFHPPEHAIREIPALRELFQQITPFRYALTEVRRFSAAVYLHPDQPERFVQIIRRITGRWPDCQPYGGAFVDIVPHLTVVDNVDSLIMNEVERCLRPRLPLACLAAEAQLLFSDADGAWTLGASFSFDGQDD